MNHGLLNLALFVFCLLVVAVAVTKFLEHWLLDPQKRRLQEKFELWWLTVSDLNKFHFALACTRAYNRLNDFVFGEKLFSKKAFFRSSIISTGLLVGSLGLTGIINHRLIGIAPWENYHQSCGFVSDLANLICNSGITNSAPIDKAHTGLITVTNSFLNSQTTFVFISTNKNGNEGGLSVQYFFGKKVSDTDTNLTQAEQWAKDLAVLRAGVEKYDTAKNATIYSIAYFIGVIAVNALLFYFALIFSRVVLREICLTARVISSVSLFLSNFFLVFFLSSFSLIALLVASMPLFWLLLPLAPLVAEASFQTFILLVYGASLGIWAINCVPLNIVIVITFLPGVFAVFATFASLILVLGRNPLHKIISAVLLRCAEKSPITVIGACFALIVAVITALVQLMRGSF